MSFQVLMLGLANCFDDTPKINQNLVFQASLKFFSPLRGINNITYNKNTTNKYYLLYKKLTSNDNNSNSDKSVH